MPQAPKLKGWKLGLGYTAFGLFAFLFFLYVTFPYDAVRNRAVYEASRAGWRLSMGSLGPGLSGLTARDVRVISDAQPILVEGMPPPPDREPLRIPRVSARPSLFPLGVAFSAELFGGEVSGAAGGLSTASLKVHASGLDPEKGNLKAFSGVDLSGRVNADLSITAPLTGGPTGKEFDLAQAEGSVSFELADFTVKGGTVTIPMGGTPTPVDLPRIALGQLTGRMRIEKGVGTLEELSGKGQDLELKGSGTVKLNKRLEYSDAALDVKLKGSPEFAKSIVGTALVMLPPDKQDPSFRSARIAGLLGNPQFLPGR